MSDDKRLLGDGEFKLALRSVEINKQRDIASAAAQLIYADRTARIERANALEEIAGDAVKAIGDYARAFDESDMHTDHASLTARLAALGITPKGSQ